MEEDDKLLREISQKLSLMCTKLEGTFDTTMDAFVQHNIKKLEEAEVPANEIHKLGEEIIASLSDVSVKTKEEKEQLKGVVSAATHLQRAVDAVRGMFPPVKIKVNEDLLFSDKAIGELKYLSENTREVIKNAGDAFLTKNQFLLGHALEKGSHLNEIADSYALEHEERLIAGVCMPKASPVFLNMLECIVRLNWYTMMALKKFFFLREE